MVVPLGIGEISRGIPLSFQLNFVKVDCFLHSPVLLCEYFADAWLHTIIYKESQSASDFIVSTKAPLSYKYFDSIFPSVSK
jgi:hypothetical protein